MRVVSQYALGLLLVNIVNVSQRVLFNLNVNQTKKRVHENLQPHDLDLLFLMLSQHYRVLHLV